MSNNDKRALMVAAVEPGTGYVRALAVNRIFKLDDPARPKNKISSDPAKAAKKIRGTYPNTTNPLISGGGDIPGYQAGSVFKIFTIVAALEQGLPAGLRHQGPGEVRLGLPEHPRVRPPAPRTASTTTARPTPAVAVPAPTDMWNAFGASVNTYFVPLQQQVGAEKVIDAAQAARHQVPRRE